MEVHGGEGVLRFFQYVAARTDIALGMFNSPSSGYVLTPEDVALIATEVPAVCATKEGTLEHWRSKAAHALAPDLVIWECDGIVYRAGWLQQGIVGPAQLGTAGYLPRPRPADPHRLLELIWDGRSPRRSNARDRPSTVVEEVSLVHLLPGRPTTSATGVRRSGAGDCRWDYPHSRPPQAILPEVAEAPDPRLYEASA
jgi:4-hydroxy-tetrahydrodipicolinate synthase